MPIRFVILFLIGLVWQYSTNQNQYKTSWFKVMAFYLQNSLKPTVCKALKTSTSEDEIWFLAWPRVLLTIFQEIKDTKLDNVEL